MDNNSHYYYKCGTEKRSGEIHCLKSKSEYKEFDIPTDYEKIHILSLSKKFADAIYPRGYLGFGIFGALAGYANAETGETQVLTKELGTRFYTIINK